MFHKEAKHGGAAGPALQPEEDRSFILAGLLVRAGQVERWDISATQWWHEFINEGKKTHTLFEQTCYHSTSSPVIAIKIKMGSGLGWGSFISL